MNHRPEPGGEHAEVVTAEPSERAEFKCPECEVTLFVSERTRRSRAVVRCPRCHATAPIYARGMAVRQPVRCSAIESPLIRPGTKFVIDCSEHMGCQTLAAALNHPAPRNGRASGNEQTIG
jgi:predicted RNA-binding Zn-ribbon protein involved in translation (DUF1610 family)